MPEIKHNFTGGKMNKDVDERLVPKGEYRHALNIQVSTSDGGDVGTVQNLLGNLPVDSYNQNGIFNTPNNYTCVGAISDEKNDAFYWFVCESQLNTYDPLVSSYTLRNMILQCKRADNGSGLEITPVFVDMQSAMVQGSGSMFGDAGNDQTNVYLNTSDPNFQDLQPGMAITAVFGDAYNNGNFTNLQFSGEIIAVDLVSGAVTINTSWQEVLTEVFNGQVNQFPFHVIVAKNQPVLGFKNDTVITGINIIDDMLFWTDGETEPKKINIPRSIEGTESTYAQTHTRLINDAQGISFSSNIPIQEEHITVIRKAPKNALNMELSDGRDTSLTYTGITSVAIEQTIGNQITSIINSTNPDVEYDFSALAIGDRVKFAIESDINFDANMDFPWEEHGFLLLKEFDSNGTSSAVPLANWTIRGMITEWVGNNFNSNNGTVEVEIRVVGLNGTPSEPPSTPGTPLFYTVDYEDTEPVIYEDKFPRFSFRYKYQDGEYSTFAPWSEVAFIPTSFNYDPKSGWNTGMLNNLKSIKIKGFKPVQSVLLNAMGLDVVEVDILYKEDVSPNIYLVQTISPLDMPLNGNDTWQSDEYEITSEEIKSMISSDQFLRPWDNVPRKALAQEITGNRIVYGNYLQNYDLNIGDKKFKPNISHSIIKWDEPSSGSPQKSIKSLRDYKLGVVFTDKYGRETPILIGESGGFRVEKEDSINANKLLAGLQQTPPAEMVWYKFYIKETSTEYYNLAMDRWYKAEDGNLWLAFPSSSRNKVDLETSLYFKRGSIDDNNVIENSTRYKILAIENEAPEFIKTRRIHIGTVSHYAVTSELFGTSSDSLYDAPSVNGVSFSLNFGNSSNKFLFAETSLSNLEDIKEDIYIQFKNENNRSAQYKVSEITSDRDETSSAASNIPSKYFITLDTSLKEDMDFIYDIPSAPSQINDGTKIIITKAVIENSPKFDGRFFAKIENDGKIQSQISDDSIGINYIEVASQKVFAMYNDNATQSLSSAASVNSAYNLVTKDYSSVVDNAHNPSGSNFNSLRTRQTFFGEINDYDVSTGWDGASHSAPNPAYSGGVWFIDYSTKKYTFPGDPHGSLVWPDTDDMNHMSPQCNLLGSSWAGGCGNYTWSPSHKIGNGITHGNEDSNIEISLGGVGTGLNFNGYYSDCGGSFSDTIHSYWDFGGESYFGGQTQSTEYNTFIASLNAGFKFKWKEDPTATVYHIQGQTSYERHCRFARHDDGFCNHKTWFIDDSSSYHKEYSITVTPSMSDWDPGGPRGEYMTNGLHLGSGVFHNADVVTGVSSGVVIELDDTSSIKAGMSAGTNSNIPLLAKVISVNNFTNTVTLDLNITGSISVGDTLEFGFTIRIVTPHMYGITGNTGSPRDNYIIVDNITTECSNGNTLEPTWSLKKGMKLDMYNLDSSSDLAFDVIIKEIDPHADGWKLTMAGYGAPLNYYQSGGNLSDDFVVGERMVFKQVTMNGASNYTTINTENSQVNSPDGDNGSSWPIGLVADVGYEMVFIEPIEEYEDGGYLPENPFIWETEPKDDTNLDIYHEIDGNFPLKLNNDTNHIFAPVGSVVTTQQPAADIPMLQSNTTVVGWDNNVVELSLEANDCDISQYMRVGFSRLDGSYVEAELIGLAPPLTAGPCNTSFFLQINPDVYWNTVELSWFNCYSFGNGVESNRIKDTFNSPFITNGVKVSTTSQQEYKEEHRKYGLIYSGLYNSTSGVNNLNQFIAAEKITKDINPIYGSIQKLYSGWGQGGDLIALCEDRILKILANKDALYNADGNTNVTSTHNVLGQAIPYSGEYGISTNPESFAAEAYRAYFTDRIRGTVMRLSMDGLTPISDHGMKDWFRDNLKLNVETPQTLNLLGGRPKLIGSYDDKKDEYNITLPIASGGPTTVSFREDVKGWVSFKSFVPENAISCANDYFTFLDGKVWKHHENSMRNNFYGDQYNSSVQVIFNEAPGSVKSFKTINYEGSNEKITRPEVDGVAYNDGEYVNLSSRKGWFVDTLNTNLEHGSITEFRKKEGKYFGHVVGEDVKINPISGAITGSYDTADSSIQGVGRLQGVPNIISQTGCSCDGGLGQGSLPANDCFGDGYPAVNYNSYATTANDSTCIQTIYGCMTYGADNFSLSANTDDGSCVWYGCMDPTAFNFDASATVDDGSCIDIVAGCWVPGMFNYDAAGVSNVACGGYNLAPGDGPNGNNLPTPQMVNYCCIEPTYGCTDPAAGNYDASANSDDGSCLYPGCIDPLASNYSFVDLVNNVPGYDGVVGVNVGGVISYEWLNGTAYDDGSCTYIGGCMDSSACYWDPTATIDDGSCYWCGDSYAVNYDYVSGPTLTGCTNNCEWCNEPPVITSIAQTTSDIINGVAQNNGTVTLTWDESTSPTILGYWLGTNGSTIEINSSTSGVGWGTGTITYTWTDLAPGTYTFALGTFCDGNAVLNTPYTLASDNGAISQGIETTATVTTTPYPGCTDGLACNYDPLANTDDGSCVDPVNCTGCDDPTYLEFCDTCYDNVNYQAVTVGSGGPWLFSDQALCTTQVSGGCTDPSMFNYDSLANGDCNNNLIGSPPYTNLGTYGDVSCCLPIVYGCIDDTPPIIGSTNAYLATNYDVNANTPCDGGVPGCNSPNCTGPGSNECCVTPCPTVSFGTLTSSWLELEYSTINTSYSAGTMNGTPLHLTVSIQVQDQSGQQLYSNSSLGGWGGGNSIHRDQNFPLSYLYPAGSGATSIDVTLTYVTNDGACGGNVTQTYTVGCTDPAADNEGIWDINDQDQCTFTGCTDSTMDADGQAQGADNYDAINTTMCGTGVDNECCTYTGDPYVNLYVGGMGSGGGNSIVEHFINTGTVYSQGAITSTIWGVSNLGAGSTYTGLNDPSGINIPGNPAGIQETGVYGWGQYVVNEVLNVTYNVNWEGIIINPSLNDTLTTTTSNSFQFTTGCRDGNASHVNWNPNLDLHISNSCVTGIQGCTDPTAATTGSGAYDASYNLDCNGDPISPYGNGTDFDCCCYGCPTTVLSNPSIDNLIEDTGGGNFYTSLNINWVPILTTLDSMVLEFKISGSLNPYVEIGITDPTALGLGQYTITPGVTAETPNGGFQGEVEYEFKLKADCTNCDFGIGDSTTYYMPNII